MAKRACFLLFYVTPKLDKELWQIAIIAKKKDSYAAMVDLASLMLRVLKRDARIISLLPQEIDAPLELRSYNVSGQDYRRLKRGALVRKMEVEDIFSRLLWVGCDFYKRVANRRKAWRINKEDLLRDFLIELALCFKKTA